MVAHTRRLPLIPYVLHLPPPASFVGATGTTARPFRALPTGTTTARPPGTATTVFVLQGLHLNKKRCRRRAPEPLFPRSPDPERSKKSAEGTIEPRGMWRRHYRQRAERKRRRGFGAFPWEGGMGKIDSEGAFFSGEGREFFRICENRSW